jgi:ATP-dependent DNA helicase RecG
VSEDLKPIIAAGENSRIEFKSAGFRNESLAKEVVAFANMKGGTIYIGIADDGELQGIDPKTEERVVNICRNGIQPAIIPEIETVLAEGKRILRVQIEKGSHKPYKVKSGNKFYIRAGSVSIEPSNEELVRLFQDGQQLHFEVSSVVPYDRKRFDLLRFREYLEKYRGLEYREEDLPALLYNLHCMDERERLSVVGTLFFAAEPSRFLPQCGIELNRFSGDDVCGELLDYQSETGPMVPCIEYALAFVKRHTSIRAVFDPESGNRVELPSHDIRIVRELIVNAFMHRDWSIFGQRILFNLFRDRLEIFSPGKLPNTLNLARALAGISYYRNPIIAQMVKDYGLADRVGRGLQVVMKYYRERNLRAPEFDADPEYFKVTVWAAGESGAGG